MIVLAVALIGGAVGWWARGGREAMRRTIDKALEDGER